MKEMLVKIINNLNVMMHYNVYLFSVHVLINLNANIPVDILWGYVFHIMVGVTVGGGGTGTGIFWKELTTGPG